MSPSTTTTTRVLMALLLGVVTTRAFVTPSLRRQKAGAFLAATSSTTIDELPPTTTTTSVNDDDDDDDDAMAQKPLSQVKADLLDLLATMKGDASEFRQVEAAVNRLESEYTVIQTLDFFNLLQTGTWQLLFSTQLTGTPNPSKFRLRELTQTVSSQAKTGTWYTQALWDWAPNADGHFTCSGIFGITHGYDITQGSRCSLTCHENDNVLKLAKGSAVPDDVPALVAMLHRSMPFELIDATGHAADTTYLDDTLRIVRYTGGRLEGVRDIFLRRENLSQVLQQQDDHDDDDDKKDGKNDNDNATNDNDLF